MTIFMAGAGAVTANAQNPTSDDHNKLLEAVRQKVAEERAKSTEPTLRGSTTAKPPIVAPATEKKMETAPAPTAPTPSVAAESPELRQLLDDLRSAVARERAASAAQPKAPESPVSASPAAPAVKETPSAPATVSTPAPAPIQPAAEPEAAPKTKQERLNNLLMLYKADRLTPHEYHEQRAKLLAEP